MEESKKTIQFFLKKGGLVMPGYMVHFASCNEEALLENESFRKGVEAPDILKKWVKLYGVEGAAKKYEEWREFAEKSGLTLPAFIRFCVSSYLKAVKKFQNSESDGTK